VQGVLEEALAKLAEGRVGVIGAGRTDAGVHAEGQVANARAATRLAPDDLLRAWNAQLPRDVAIRALVPAPPDYHARRAARSKLYAYRLWTGVERSPLRDRSSLWKRPPLDLAALRAASTALVGRYDFASFCAAGGEAHGTVRTITRAEWIGAVGGDLRFEVEGPGFLRHMVRNVVGSLLEVGRGRRPPSWIGELMEARDRTRAGPTAPARGLVLVRVDDGFPEGIRDVEAGSG
jgi:tRNA pseudouridine38-40 synthase